MRFRQVAPAARDTGVRTPPFPGERRHPARPYLEGVEHGNPVVRRVRSVGTPVRGADVCGGNRMVQEAKARTSKDAGKRAVRGCSSCGRRAITTWIPDCVSGRESGLT